MKSWAVPCLRIERLLFLLEKTDSQESGMPRMVIMHEGKVTDSDLGQLVALVNDHSASVTCCAISSDGKLIATGSTDKTLIIYEWDGSKLAKKTTLKGHTKVVKVSTVLKKIF